MCEMIVRKIYILLLKVSSMKGSSINKALKLDT